MFGSTLRKAIICRDALPVTSAKSCQSYDRRASPGIHQQRSGSDNSRRWSCNSVPVGVHTALSTEQVRFGPLGFRSRQAVPTGTTGVRIICSALYSRKPISIGGFGVGGAHTTAKSSVMLGFSRELAIGEAIPGRFRFCGKGSSQARWWGFQSGSASGAWRDRCRACEHCTDAVTPEIWRILYTGHTPVRACVCCFPSGNVYKAQWLCFWRRIGVG